MVNEHSHFLINVLTAAAAITASSIMVDWCALAESITFCKARTHTHMEEMGESFRNAQQSGEERTSRLVI